MNKRHGLGKGLNALIPSNIEDSIKEDEKNVNLISLNLIKANSKQPRTKFDIEKIKQLAESIKEHGVIQPLVLKKEGKTYSIIAGERRWRASKMASIKEVPAVIMDLSDKEILEVSLIENIQREDLNPIEEARAYKKLIEDFNLTQEEVSKRIGKSRTAITNCLRLLNLDSRVQDYLIDEVISEGHGRAILSIQDYELQYKTSQFVIDNNLSVRETERYIKNMDKQKTEVETSKKQNPYYVDIENRLENLLGTKVSLKNKKDKQEGKIEIQYYSKEDLQRILDLIKLQ